MKLCAAWYAEVVAPWWPRGAAPESTLAFVALGSNVDGVPMIRGASRPRSAAARPQSRTARICTRRCPRTSRSSPRFLNAVCSLRTTLPPHGLLRALKDIERRFGRDASSAIYGPRCLDLDLLMYGAHVGTFSSAPQLELPHPRIAEPRVRVPPAARRRAGCHAPVARRVRGDPARAHRRDALAARFPGERLAHLGHRFGAHSDHGAC